MSFSPSRWGRALLGLTALVSSFSGTMLADAPGTRPAGHTSAPSPNTLTDKFFAATGKVYLSVDGSGTLGASAPIRVQKPSAGATVRRAFLMAASVGFTGYAIPDGSITLNGFPVPNWSAGVANGIGSNNYRADVTAIVKPIIDAAGPGLSILTVAEGEPSSIDGEVLAVVFDDPAQPTVTTILMLFGFLQTGGDTFSITMADPIDPLDPAAIAIMGLGISYGFQGANSGPPQYSEIDVNGKRLTSSAGGYDDIATPPPGANGALITVGGIGDSTANPVDPFQLPPTTGTDQRTDDELYTLLPLITSSTKNVLVKTNNPSDDDNIFFSYFVLSGAAVFGGGIVLGPVTAARQIGTNHTVTATVVDEGGAPRVGVPVAFQVLLGPNFGRTGSGVTDENGEATFTYTGTGGIGTDQIQASFSDGATLVQSNVATARWAEVVFRIDAAVPPWGKPGQTRTVGLVGSGFKPESTFAFGAGINVDLTFPGSPNAATVQITIAPDAAIGFRNVSGVQSAGPDAETDTLVKGYQVALSIEDAAITKSHSGAFSAGTNNAFTIKVKNLGEDPTSSTITVTDNLPRGLSFVSGVGAGWSCSAVGRLVTCTYPGQLAANGGETSFVLTVAVDARAIPAVTNSATVQLTGDLDPTNDKSTDFVSVIGLDLALSKSHTGNFAVGSNGAFNLRVKNVGTVPTIPASPLLVGSIANSRFGTDWTLDGPNMKRTREKLLDAANFGTGGTIPRPITIDSLSQPGAITQAILDEYDVFFIGYLLDSSPSAFTTAELDAMKGYVRDGGTMIVTCDDPGYDKVCDSFGYPVLSTAPNPLTPTATGIAHPIFDGPFGKISTFDGSQTIGYFFDASGSTVLARDGHGLPVMIEKTLGAGRVILMSDVDFIAQACTAGSTITSANDKLLGNLFAYAAKFAPIVVTDTLPPGLTYVSASGAGWTCSGSGSTFTCTSPGPLAPGQFSDISLTVAVGAAAAPVATNRGRVSLTNDSNPSNDTAQDTVTIGGSVPTPSVNEITPNFGPIAGGTAVTITGSNFDPGAAVVFDGTYYASSVVVVDAATITCLTPPHVAGAVDVVVVNPSGQNRSLQGGFTYLTTTPTSGFYTVTPCRAVDTRGANGPYGGPALSAGSPRSFVLGGQCGVPADAKALALNVTAVGPTKGGNIRLYPTGNSPGASSTLNFGAGQTRANNALAGVDAAGSLTVLADGPPDMTVHLIVDVSGYFK